MYKSELDIPVALIFFTRSETLKKVFDKVKHVRPGKLFLIQDGPRKGNDNDPERIKACRDIVENIDWECEIFRNYSETNLGCGARPYTGISWVFQNVDKAIILEDDCVPADSFFYYCRDMLYRYEADLRIGIISGFNYFNEYDFGGYSYGFVKTGSIWGWATWKDRWIKYDYELKKIEEDYIRKSIKSDITPRFAAKKRIKTWVNARNEIESNKYVSYWDYQWGFTRHLNSWLSIVPKYSQISNIGIGTGSTHSGNSIRAMPKKIASFFFMDTKQLELPLIHPDFVLVDRNYDAKYYRIIYPNLFIEYFRKISWLLNKIFRK